MNIEFYNAYKFCISVILLMREADALESDVDGWGRGVWHQDRRNGISLYLQTDSQGSRIEVWRKRRVFLATCSHNLKNIQVEQYAPGPWEIEVEQLGRLASLPTRRPWREGSLH